MTSGQTIAIWDEWDVPWFPIWAARISGYWPTTSIRRRWKFCAASGQAVCHRRGGGGRVRYHRHDVAEFRHLHDVLTMSLRKSPRTARCASFGKSIMLAPLPVAPSAADQRGHTLGTEELDPLGVIGIGGGGRKDGSWRTVAESHQRRGEILRLHAVRHGGPGPGRRPRR